MLLFLVGYMGCGKSSIGRALARRIGFRFLDMDTLLEERCGQSVREIFSAVGEERFRELERDVLRHLADDPSPDAVVATGGGAPCFFDNMDRMNEAGITVYFQMSPQKLAARLEHGKAKRPLLKDKTPEELFEFIRDNLSQRETFYLRSRLIIGCDGVNDDYIVAHVERYLENYSKGK